jgi:TonB family protein
MNLLLDSALKATVILCAACVAAQALRRASASARHLIWLAAVLAVALIPAVLSIPQGAIPSAPLMVVPAAIGSSAATSHLPWVLLLWACGAAIVLIRLILGFVAAVRITRSARFADGFFYSDRAATPMTWGFLRPVVILPTYAEGWADAERDLVIRHEQAHIVRHDWLCQMLSSLVTAVFWFHPLMWLANAQLRREAEGAVDDCVLAAGVAPSDYASRLLDVARHMHGVSLPAVVLPMVGQPELETRVRSILDPTRRRGAVGLVARCAIGVAAIALIFPIAVTRQRVYAQGTIYKMGDGISAPKIIYKEEPVYTPEAKDDKIEGTVALRGVITPAGRAESMRVLKSLDPGLDANAVTAVSNWRFQPAMKDGKPVSVYVTIEVNFHLL